MNNFGPFDPVPDFNGFSLAHYFDQLEEDGSDVQSK